MKTFGLAFCFFLIQTVFSIASEKVAPLVDAEWLQQNLNTQAQVTLDVRPAKNYAKGHIQGAVSAPYNQGWRKTIDGVIGMLPPVDEIVTHIRSLGIDNDEHVILLPHGNSSTDFGAATRIYWTFKVLGHDKVSILDGGYKAWEASRGDLSTEVVKPATGTFNATFRAELLANEAQVQQASGKVDLVDARPLSQFKGKSKSPVVKKAGTIPQSKNLIQSKLYDAKNASFANLEKLSDLTSSAEISGEGQTIAFCNTGHWASIAWFALSEVQGRRNVSLYDGSMMEWTLDDSNEVQRTQ